MATPRTAHAGRMAGLRVDGRGKNGSCRGAAGRLPHVVASPLCSSRRRVRRQHGAPPAAPRNLRPTPRRRSDIPAGRCVGAARRKSPSGEATRGTGLAREHLTELFENTPGATPAEHPKKSEAPDRVPHRARGAGQPSEASGGWPPAMRMAADPLGPPARVPRRGGTFHEGERGPGPAGGQVPDALVRARLASRLSTRLLGSLLFPTPREAVYLIRACLNVLTCPPLSAPARAGQRSQEEAHVVAGDDAPRYQFVVTSTAPVA